MPDITFRISQSGIIKFTVQKPDIIFKLDTFPFDNVAVDEVVVSKIIRFQVIQEPTVTFAIGRPDITFNVDHISSYIHGIRIDASEIDVGKILEVAPSGDVLQFVNPKRCVTQQLTYTNPANKVIGPLGNTPGNTFELTIFPQGGPPQIYGEDYTVRRVVGGTNPGYYICIGKTSTAPSGGSFSGGSNPSGGIDHILESGDLARITYPIN